MEGRGAGKEEIRKGINKGREITRYLRSGEGSRGTTETLRETTRKRI